ncbi:DUF1996 domain-containing protein [Erythrobacter sp. W53]|uniref:DUF1996 domain-containing protein n=1 Tax=Erythrobacter sp. W53 TaxID=3425947 RepID=UPI003D768046
MRNARTLSILALSSLVLTGCGGGSGASPTGSSVAISDPGSSTSGGSSSGGSSSGGSTSGGSTSGGSTTGGSTSGGSTSGGDGTGSPPTDPAPAPAPDPAGQPITGGNRTQGFPQLDRIPTNFSVSQALQPTWGTGEIPGSAFPDVVGAFRFLCKPSHLSYDDPIVFPGQKGRSHLHMYFGNTEADADSTYESLRTTGDSTCRGPLNRSAYWIPALLDGRGNVVMPEFISIYYKRYPNTDPKCAEGEGCIALPRGLRYVFGRTMNGELPDRESATYFNCDGPGARPGRYDTLVEAAQNCPSGARIGALLTAPDCWDGEQLDSVDHRSHMSYEVRNSTTGVASCPASHPYRVPTFTLAAWYETDDTLDRSGNTDPNLQTWHFSSDRMEGRQHMTSGTTFHADWFGAWDDEVMSEWMANCIDLKLNCSGGDLGAGRQLVASAAHQRDFARRVDVPRTNNPVSLAASN